MSLTKQNANFISELCDWSEQILNLRDEGSRLLARWHLNGISNRLMDEDIQSVFASLDKNRIIAGVVALEALITALGNNVDGHAASLIRLKE